MLCDHTQGDTKIKTKKRGASWYGISAVLKYHKKKISFSLTYLLKFSPRPCLIEVQRKKTTSVKLMHFKNVDGLCDAGTFFL